MPTKPSRSERRLERDIHKAITRRESLLQRGKLSLPSGNGVLAIIASSRTTYPTAFDAVAVRKEHAARLEEAERLAQEQRGQHQDVVIRRKAHISSIRLDLADPDITDVIFMGHGTINSIMTDDGAKYFSWQDVSRAAPHLKQGVVEQRMCGAFPRDMGLLVPMGTFAVSLLTNLRAAPGVGVPLADGTNARDKLFQPIFTATEPLFDQILALNASHAEQEGRSVVA